MTQPSVATWASMPIGRPPNLPMQRDLRNRADFQNQGAQTRRVVVTPCGSAGG